MKAYNAIDIAKYVIVKCMNDEKPITHLNLQKVLYFIQAEYLKNGEQLFADDFHAWEFGPAIESVYVRYCSWGGNKIRTQYNDCDLDNKIKFVIDPIIERKREKFPWDLVAESQANGSAWENAYDIGKYAVIQKQWIDKWDGVLVNDFEETVFAKFPELAAIKRSLYDCGAVYASMSGSGSALFAIYTK